MRQDVYYQPDKTDAVLADDVVLGIVHQHAPDAVAVRRIDETGGEARAYHVDGDITLKVQRPHRLRASTSLRREVFFLRQLEAHPEVRVPRVLGYGHDDDIEYICMTRIPGVPVHQADLTPQAHAAMLVDLGATLRAIHDIDQEPFENSGLFPRDDDTDLAERLRRRKYRQINAIDAETSQRKDAVKRKVDDELARLGTPGGFVALHTNPAITHTFVDPATGAFTGLIDFGDTYIGHPILDMWYWSPVDRRHLLDGYTAHTPVSDQFMAVFDALDAIDRIIDQVNSNSFESARENGWE